MDFERWVTAKVDEMKMKIVAESSGLPTPKKIMDKISKTDPNSRNNRGETIMISVVRYVPDEIKQVKLLQILFRSGANANLADLKHGRTPLMYACQERKRAACLLLINHPSVDPKVKDKLGNNALMYAATNGDSEIIATLTSRLTKMWSFDVFTAKNLAGKTAQNVAVSNGKVNCAVQLNKERVNMVKNLHKQMSLVKRSGQQKGWSGFGHAYKWGKVWADKSTGCKPHPTVASLCHSQRLSRSCTQLPTIDLYKSALYRSKSDTFLKTVDSFLHLSLIV